MNAVDREVKKTAVVGLFALCILVLAMASTAMAAVQPMVRLKDIATIEGVRENQLVGMGLVVGLQGTGDKGPMATQMMSNMSQQFGVTMDPKQIRSKNAAVVSVTCQLSPFLLPGQNTDVLVSAIGDAKSLEGGVLLQTPLKAANGQVYAVAQGPLTLGGWSDSGAASTVKKNVVTVGRIPNGAIVEQGVAMEYASNGQINLLLRQNDFTTAQRVCGGFERQIRQRCARDRRQARRRFSSRELPEFTDVLHRLDRGSFGTPGCSRPRRG